MMVQIYNPYLSFPTRESRLFARASDDEIYSCIYHMFMLSDEIINSHSHFLLHFSEKDYSLIKRLVNAPYFRCLIDNGYWKLSIWNTFKTVSEQIEVYVFHYCNSLNLPTYLRTDKRTYADIVKALSNAGIYYRDINTQSSYAFDLFANEIQGYYGDTFVDRIGEVICFEEGGVKIFSIESVYLRNFSARLKVDNAVHRELIKLAADSYKRVAPVGNPDSMKDPEYLFRITRKKNPSSIHKMVMRIIHEYEPFMEIYKALREGKLIRFSDDDLNFLKNLYRNIVASKLRIDYNIEHS